MRKSIRMSLVVAVFSAVVIGMIALVGCTQPAIELDPRISRLTAALNKDITGTLEQAETINALARAGVELKDEVYTALTDNVVAAIRDNTVTLGQVTYATMALLYSGRILPVEITDYMRAKSYSPGWSARWTSTVMLPAAVQADSLGYNLTLADGRQLTDVLVEEVVATATDGVITSEWGYDEICASIISLAPFAADNADIKSIIDKSIENIGNGWQDILETLPDDAESGTATCTAGYILRMAVELDYYGIEHSIDEKALYDGIIALQGEDGLISIGQAPVQALEALLSYQRYVNGDKTTYYTAVAK